MALGLYSTLPSYLEFVGDPTRENSLNIDLEEGVLLHASTGVVAMTYRAHFAVLTFGVLFQGAYAGKGQEQQGPSLLQLASKNQLGMHFGAISRVTGHVSSYHIVPQKLSGSGKITVYAKVVDEAYIHPFASNEYDTPALTIRSGVNYHHSVPDTRVEGKFDGD
ncbi:hypothetical protein BDQ17DRAFT_1336673 [Cyathus striatus]|nr:hypothetical protein BDQ17DRAFT_1336673 [Cyathus striatus]